MALRKFVNRHSGSKEKIQLNQFRPTTAVRLFDTADFLKKFNLAAVGDS